jgi:hypothetical protein
MMATDTITPLDEEPLPTPLASMGVADALTDALALGLGRALFDVRGFADALGLIVVDAEVVGFGDDRARTTTVPAIPPWIVQW